MTNKKIKKEHKKVEKELTNFMKKKGGILESLRGDRAYYSKIDNKYLLRFNIGGEFMLEPVVLKLENISTLRKTNLKSESFKIPLNIKRF